MLVVKFIQLILQRCFKSVYPSERGSPFSEDLQSKIYSGISEHLGPRKVSCIERCPLFGMSFSGWFHYISNVGQWLSVRGPGKCPLLRECPFLVKIKSSDDFTVQVLNLAVDYIIISVFLAQASLHCFGQSKACFTST